MEEIKFLKSKSFSKIQSTLVIYIDGTIKDKMKLKKDEKVLMYLYSNKVVIVPYKYKDEYTQEDDLLEFVSKEIKKINSTLVVFLEVHMKKLLGVSDDDKYTLKHIANRIEVEITR